MNTMDAEDSNGSTQAAKSAVTRCPHCGSLVDLDAPGPITGLWLDQPATLWGEPITMGGRLPLWAKIYGAIVAACIAFIIGVLILGKLGIGIN